MKILVLGHKGMLGHVVYRYLEEQQLDVEYTNFRWPSFEFKKRAKEYRGDYIINCIGNIPQKKDDFKINHKLPVWLDINTKCKIIHAASDCENKLTSYSLSKLKASQWIINFGNRTKIIKSSIIGPELKNKVNLMEWFLSQEGSINGYVETYWNGNTTLTWAKHCYRTISSWEDFDIETTLQGECISKYNLLLSLNEVFEAKKHIIPYTNPYENRCLTGDVKTESIKEQLTELKSWIQKNKFLYL